MQDNSINIWQITIALVMFLYYPPVDNPKFLRTDDGIEVGSKKSPQKFHSSASLIVSLEECLKR